MLNLYSGGNVSVVSYFPDYENMQVYSKPVWLVMPWLSTRSYLSTSLCLIHLPEPLHVHSSPHKICMLRKEEKRHAYHECEYSRGPYIFLYSQYLKEAMTRDLKRTPHHASKVSSSWRVDKTLNMSTGMWNVRIEWNFSSGASAEGHCWENMKIAEHAYFIWLSGLVSGGWSARRGCVRFTYTNKHARTRWEHTWQLFSEGVKWLATRAREHRWGAKNLRRKGSKTWQRGRD